MIGVASYLLLRPTTTTASTNIRDQVFITKAIFDNEPTSLESSEVWPDGYIWPCTTLKISPTMSQFFKVVRLSILPNKK